MTEKFRPTSNGPVSAVFKLQQENSLENRDLYLCMLVLSTFPFQLDHHRISVHLTQKPCILPRILGCVETCPNLDAFARDSPEL